MKKSNKLVNMVIVSSALLTTNIVSFADNTNSSTSVDMQLGIVKNEGGKSVNLSIYNVSTASSFKLSLKLEGDVELKSIEFSPFIKENATANYEYNPDTKTIEIVVTSTIDLVNDATLNIGKVVVEGNDNVKYSVIDNSAEDEPAIVIVTPTQDEVYDNDLEEVGDTTIIIEDTPSVEDDKEDSDETPEVPPVQEENPEEEKPQAPPSQEEQKPQNPPTQDEEKNETTDKNETTTDIEVTTGKDGYKIVTPKTKKALDSVIAEILKVDSTAKIVEIKEEGNYYVYKVKVMKVTKDTNKYDYVNIKVSKEISNKKELPGIAVETTTNNNNANTGTNSSNTTNKPQTGDNSLSTIIYSAMAIVASVIGLVYVNKKQAKEVKTDRDTYRRKND